MTLAVARRSSFRDFLADRTVRSTALLTALLVSTQIIVTIPNPFSLGGGKSLPLAEIPLALITVWLVVSWFRHREVRFAADDRYLLAGLLLFAVTLIVVTALRAILQNRASVSTTTLEYMLFGITFYFMLRLRWFSTKELVLSIHGLLVVAQATALFRVIADETTLRLAGPLGNANMYVGFAVLVLPFLVWYGVNSASRLWLWGTLAQVGAIVAFVALSGSRFGGVAIVAELVVVFVLIDDRPWRKRLLNIGMAAGLCWLIIGAILVVSPETSGDFQRTINLKSAVEGRDVASAGDRLPTAEEWAPLPKVAGGPGIALPSDPADVDPGNPDVDVWSAESASMRARLWPRAINVIRDHWALGTGRGVIYYYGWGYQTPHSLILNPAIALGVFGALALWILLLRVPISTARAVRTSREARAVLLGALVLIACSLFQPLLDSVLVIVIMYWGLFAIGLDRAPLGSRGDEAPQSGSESPSGLVEASTERHISRQR